MAKLQNQNTQNPAVENDMPPVKAKQNQGRTQNPNEIEDADNEDEY